MEQQYDNRQQPRQNPQRRVVRRRRVRYDRIAIALGLLILVFVLFFSCTCNCIKCVCSPSENAGTSDTSSDSSQSTTDETSAAATEPGLVPTQNAAALTLSADDMHKGALVVVNADHAYTFPADDVTLINVVDKANSSYTLNDNMIQLDDTTVTQLNQMLSEFHTLYGNDDIQLEAGYRSKQDQDERYSNGSSIFAGGYSDYHTGRSFDLGISPDDGVESLYVSSGDYSWISENAHKYGFVLRYPEGKIDYTGVNPRSYTFRYVGEPHAKYMYDNDLCLEEYVEELKSYPATSPLTVTTENGTWTVFYTELATSGSAVINIPNCEEYTISGDNIGGFIVAYR